jgi:hypothetical protein
MSKNPDGTTSISREKSSKKVLDCFFEKAWENPILKSRNTTAF